VPWERGAKGVFSFQREYPLWTPQRKARGGPLDPRHCRIGARRAAHAAHCTAVGSSAALRMWHTPCG